MELNELEKKVTQASKMVEQLLAVMEKQQELISANEAEIKKQNEVIKANYAEMKKQEARINKNRKDLVNFAQNIRYEMGDSKRFESSYWYPKIMEQSLTMKQLIDQRKSYLRFTETELNMLLHSDVEEDDPNVEENSLLTGLRERLNHILRSENENYLIALPDIFGALDFYKINCRMKFRDFLTEERRQKLMELLPQHKNYHDANMMHPDEYDELKSMTALIDRYRMLTPLWNGKKIVAITAAKTGLTTDNPYFASASSMMVIEVPQIDALSHYNEILDKCMAEQNYQTIYLIAAGPMGVVLGADICKAGSQAIDIGTLGRRYKDYCQKYKLFT